MERVQILDHGYIRFIEDWGHGKAGEPEAGIIEAARQSTQGSFRSWGPYQLCERCGEWWVGTSVLELGKLMCPDSNSGRSHEIKEYPRGDMGLLAFMFNGRPQHATPFEFCGMVIEVQAPIFVFREWHRHRTQSYNEMSARYAPLPNLNYVPSVERLMMVSKTNKQAGVIKDAPELTELNALWYRDKLNINYLALQRLYEEALNMGVPKELARIHLPVGRYSRMRASANLRNWLAFITLRADPAAQWEIRQYAIELGNIIAARFPRTWSLFVESRK